MQTLTVQQIDTIFGGMRPWIADLAGACEIVGGVAAVGGSAFSFFVTGGLDAPAAVAGAGSGIGLIGAGIATIDW